MAANVPLLLFAEEDVEGGGKSIENDFAYKNNVQQSSIHIRMAFLRKVYSLLFIQLAVTVVMGFAFMFTPILRFYIHNKGSLLQKEFCHGLITLTILGCSFLTFLFKKRGPMIPDEDIAQQTDWRGFDRAVEDFDHSNI